MPPDIPNILGAGSKTAPSRELLHVDGYNAVIKIHILQNDLIRGNFENVQRNPKQLRNTTYTVILNWLKNVIYTSA